MMNNLNSSVSSIHYQSLSLREKASLHYKKKFSNYFGLVPLSKVFVWSQSFILMFHGENLEKTRSVKRRIYSDELSVKWRKGGFIFTSINRLMDIEDCLESRGVETRSFMLKDIADDAFDLTSITILPNGVATIFVGDNDVSVNNLAFARLITEFNRQCLVMYSIDDLNPKGNEIFPVATEFQMKRWRTPFVIEGGLSDFNLLVRSSPMLRTMFQTICFDRRSRSDFSSAFQADGDLLREVVSNVVSVILDDHDDFSEMIPCSFNSGIALKNQEFAESFQSISEVTSCKGYQKSHECILAMSNAFLRVCTKHVEPSSVSDQQDFGENIDDWF